MGSYYTSPGDLPDPGTELSSSALAGGFLTAEHQEAQAWGREVKSQGRGRACKSVAINHRRERTWSNLWSLMEDRIGKVT